MEIPRTDGETGPAGACSCSPIGCPDLLICMRSLVPSSLLSLTSTGDLLWGLSLIPRHGWTAPSQHLELSLAAIITAVTLLLLLLMPSPQLKDKLN